MSGTVAAPSHYLQLRWTVPDDRRAGFEAWYEEEHLADMLAVPGIDIGVRYRRQPSYPHASPTDSTDLTLYSVASVDAFDTGEYRRLVEEPSERTMRTADGLGMGRVLYRCLPSPPTPSGATGPALGTGRALLHIMTGCDPSVDEDFNRWYDEEHLPAIAAVPGVLGGRRLVDTAPAASPGGVRFPLRYLAVYELEDAAVASGPAMADAGRPTAWRRRLGESMEAHIQLYAPVQYLRSGG